MIKWLTVNKKQKGGSKRGNKKLSIRPRVKTTRGFFFIKKTLPWGGKYCRILRMKRIYLDHAATTYMDPAVKKAMDAFFIENFGNPSAIYEEGRIAKKAISDARLSVARSLGAQPDEIIFTGGGTQGDNLAIFGAARHLAKTLKKGATPHIITSKIEHHAVLYSFEQLENEGFEVSYINVGKDGIIDLKQFKESLRPETILVSVMLANNEIGAIQPISEISKAIRLYKKEKGGNASDPLFHTDAVQAPSYIDLNVLKPGVDLLSLNGSKIYGPKGVGALYIKRGIKISPLSFGGGQEKGINPGTENVPAIVGLAKALELAQKEREKESARLSRLRDYFIKGILKSVPDTVLNGSAEKRLPNNVNISFLGVEGESIVLYLDARGIACSTGSACNSDNLEVSHVIRALGRPYEYAHGSVRFTLGKKTKKEDIDYVLKVLPEIIKKLRNMSAI